MAVRKLAKSWQYDFKLPGFGRHRQGGYQTKAEALLAEKTEREALLSGARQLLFSEAYAEYLAATSMKARARDAYDHVWRRIKPELGHLYIEEVGTSATSKRSGLPRWIPSSRRCPSTWDRSRSISISFSLVPCSASCGSEAS